MTRRPAHHVAEQTYPVPHACAVLSAEGPDHKAEDRRVCKLFQDPDDDTMINPLAELTQQR